MKTFAEALTIFVKTGDPTDRDIEEAKDRCAREVSMVDEIRHNEHARAFVHCHGRPVYDCLVRLAIEDEAADQIMEAAINAIGSCFAQGVIVGIEMERQDMPELDSKPAPKPPGWAKALIRKIRRLSSALYV